MKKLILILLVFTEFSAHAQEQADSLLQLIPKLTGEAKAEVLNQLSTLYTETDSTLALNYANKALEIAKQINNKDLIAESYLSIGKTFSFFDEYKTASEYFQRSLDLVNENTNINLIGDIYLAFGISLTDLSKYNEASDCLFKAINYFEKDNGNENIAKVYNEFGWVNSKLQKDEKSLEYFQIALNMAIDGNFEESIPDFLNGVGAAYFYLQMLDSAKLYFEKSLELFRQQNKEQRVATTLTNLAGIYANKDELTKAFEYYNEALRIYEKLNRTRKIIIVYRNLSEAYRLSKDYEKAIETCNIGLELVNTLEKEYELKKGFYGTLSLTYEEMGQYKEALTYYGLYDLYSDSLLQEEQLNHVAELETQFETEKKQAEIDRLNTQNEMASLEIKKNKVIRTYGFITIFLLLGIVIITYRGYSLKKRTNALLSNKNIQIESQRLELEELNVSKNKFFSILAHDLKNPFHTVMGYSYLLNKEYERFNETDRKKYAGDINKSANSIFRLLQNLLDWSRSQTGGIKYHPTSFDFNKVYAKVEVVLKSLAADKNMELISKIPDKAFVFADPMMIETVLRNLLGNAIKFSAEGNHVITTLTTDDKIATVCVEDNGTGISGNDLKNLFHIGSKVKRKGTNDEEGSGLGLILCKEFVQITKGDIWAESELHKGSKFYFTIPLENPDQNQS